MAGKRAGRPRSAARPELWLDWRRGTNSTAVAGATALQGGLRPQPRRTRRRRPRSFGVAALPPALRKACSFPARPQNAFSLSSLLDWPA